MPTFPTITLLDNFNRANETPLEGASKTQWKKLSGSGVSMKLETNKAHVNESGDGGSVNIESANYWTVEEFNQPAAAILTGTETGRSMNLFICLQNPATEATGYQLRAHVGAPNKFDKFQLNKENKGTRSLLAEKTEIAFTPETDLVGISIEGGKVYGWIKRGAGAWEVVVEATDSTWTKGFSGIGGAGTGVQFDNFESGSGTKKPSVIKPANQKSVVNHTIKPLQIEGALITEYKAEELPEGLSINSSTGLITGTPTKVETKTVKITVHGEEAPDATTEFEWVIEPFRLEVHPGPLTIPQIIGYG